MSLIKKKAIMPTESISKAKPTGAVDFPGKNQDIRQEYEQTNECKHGIRVFLS
ncbi:hypothetical protein BBR01nite_54790 [Brevibacillus brevis]|nr:hypothetical protein BBR01nite_54790 [Brevibacillus brevis]